MLGVAQVELHGPPQCGCALTREREHRRAQVDASKTNSDRVMRQVAPGADANLQNVTDRARCHPLAPAAEQELLEGSDRTVVARRGAIVEGSNAIRRRVGHGVAWHIIPPSALLLG